MSVFRSAVTGEDGSVDPGYLGLYVVMLIVLGAIPSAIVLTGIAMFYSPGHKLDLVGLGAVIAAATAGFGTAAGGVGLFRMGDKSHAPAAASSSTTTIGADQSIRQEIVTTPAEPGPAPPDPRWSEARDVKGTAADIRKSAAALRQQAEADGRLLARRPLGKRDRPGDTT
jgi:hypothetical protein